MERQPEIPKTNPDREWLFDVTLTGGEPVDKVAELVGFQVGKISAALVILWFSASGVVKQLRRFSQLKSMGG